MPAQRFDHTLDQLAPLGLGDGVRFLLDLAPSSGIPANHILADFLRPHDRPREELKNFDRALAAAKNVVGKHQGWFDDLLARIWTDDASTTQGALAELEAFGLLGAVFPAVEPTPLARRSRTPDFRVPNSFNIEVYAPRESAPNREEVERILGQGPEPDQPITVRVALSHPITGSNGDALMYPANKTIDRVLNAKRDGGQAVPGEVNILYLDLRREWGVRAFEASPSLTYEGQGMHYVGTFGVWHAFYGEAGRRTLLPDRASTYFLPFLESAYAQQQQGFFRERTQWSAAVLAVTDGVVLFENPWADVPVSESLLRDLLRLDRCRIERSWFRGGAPSDQLAQRVEYELNRMEWLMGRRLIEDTEAEEAPEYSGLPTDERRC